jgi:RND superfamily putative drug exporter
VVRLTSFVLSRPRSVLVAWLILLAAGGALSLQLDGALKAGGFTDPRGEATLAQQTLEQRFDEPANTLLVVLSASSDSVATHLDAARTALEQAGANSIADYRSHPSWISTDDRTTFLQVGFGQDNTAVQNLVPTLEREVATAVGNDVRVNVTGQPALDYALNVRSEQDAARAEIIALPILIVIRSWFSDRSSRWQSRWFWRQPHWPSAAESATSSRERPTCRSCTATSSR